MGILILITVGALLGWLASIVLRREDRHSVLTLVAAGLGGSLIVGFISGGANLFAGVGAQQLLWSTLGAAVAISIAAIVRERVYR